MAVRKYARCICHSFLTYVSSDKRSTSQDDPFNVNVTHLKTSHSDRPPVREHRRKVPRQVHLSSLAMEVESEGDPSSFHHTTSSHDLERDPFEHKQPNRKHESDALEDYRRTRHRSNSCSADASSRISIKVIREDSSQKSHPEAMPLVTRHSRHHSISYSSREVSAAAGLLACDDAHTQRDAFCAIDSSGSCWPILSLSLSLSLSHTCTAFLITFSVSEALLECFYYFYSRLSDTQKAIFVNETLTILKSVTFTVSKLMEYIGFGHPFPDGCGNEYSRFSSLSFSHPIVPGDTSLCNASLPL